MLILGIASQVTAGFVSDYESIATTTVGSGGASTINFNSIGSNYLHLQIRVFGISSNLESIRIRFNSDTGSNYFRSNASGDGASASGSQAASQTALLGSLLSGSSTSPGSCIIDIYDYANTNKRKSIITLGGYDANGSGSVMLRPGVWNSSNAITDIELAMTSGTFGEHTRAALYGIKG